MFTSLFFSIVQANPILIEEPGEIQAAMKVNNKIYLFYEDIVKIHEGDLQSAAILKRPEEIFTGARPAGEKLRIEAALYFGGGRVYLFEGDQALAFDSHPTEVGIYQFIEAESGKITERFDLPPYWSHVDAAIRYDVHTILFFHGPGLLVYNLHTKRTGREFPIFQSSYTRLLGKVQLAAAFKGNQQHTVFIPKREGETSTAWGR